MLELRVPDPLLRPAWLEAHAEWGPGTHEDGFGIEPGDDVRTAAGFARWVARLRAQADPGTAASMGRRPATFRWVVRDGAVLGGIVLRHELGEWTRSLGHVGYGVRPSARRRGVATWALLQVLGVARDVGLASVDVVCEATNVASVRTIERAGGVPVAGPHDGTRRFTVSTDRGHA